MRVLLAFLVIILAFPAAALEFSRSRSGDTAVIVATGKFFPGEWGSVRFLRHRR